MTYSTFNKNKNNPLFEPMFLGNSVNVSRFDQQKLPIFEKLIEKQISFFWRPEEVDISKDRMDWQKLTESERHIFISNLKYQTLLDSIAARSVNVTLLPIVSLPEIETWVETLFRQKLTLNKRVSEWMSLPTRVIGQLSVMVNLPEISKKITRSLPKRVVVTSLVLAEG